MSGVEGLVYIGKIVKLEEIPGADLIESATVVCGEAGRWRGVIRKSPLNTLDGRVVVYLPDSLIPESSGLEFMRARGWRVKMCRFRGVPSEVLIVPWSTHADKIGWEPVGRDVTERLGVVKYEKPVPAHLQGFVKGPFPAFIPKTDEPNYQSNFDLVEKLHGHAYYVSVKMDGSSTTAYKYKGCFGVCSRNLELIEDDKNGYWQIAKKYQLEKSLPEGYALQWETCGPKIQGNRMGLKEISGFAFSAYNIYEQKYLEYEDFFDLCKCIGFPHCDIVDIDDRFDKEGLEYMGEGRYSNGEEREGVVVRSIANFGAAPISFKVINLNYEK